jgi:hypothetical protein
MLRTGITRRGALMAGLAGGLAGVWGTSLAGPATLPAAASLPDELAHALKSGGPLVVMVSLEGCPFCKVTRENYLAPMVAQQSLPVVQIDMHSNLPVKDFKGLVTTHDQMIRAWGVKVAPTVLFFGRGGTEVAERLVGSYLPDFYGAYLDGRLLAARSVIAG